MAKGRWVDITGRIFVNEQDAAARLRELQRQFPAEKFRTFGHSLVGWCVQRREPAP